VENQRCIWDSTCIPVYEQFFCFAMQIDEFHVACFLYNCLQRATDIYWRLILHCTENGYLLINLLYSTSYTSWFITLWKECQRIDIINEMNNSFQAICFPPVTWLQWFWTFNPHSALVFYCIHCSSLGNVYKEFIYKFTK